MTLKHRVLVCGGRDFNDAEKLKAVMEWIRPYLAKDFCLIHGSARGADMTAHLWAFFEGCPVIEMKANWDKYGKAAGHIRNKWMLDYAMPDLVVAFPGGRGTADMVRQAKAAGIDTQEIS